MTMKEEIRPVVVEGVEIPGYWVSNTGKVFVGRFAKRLPGRLGFKTIIDESRMYEMSVSFKSGYARVCLSIPDNILTEYDYRRRNNGGLRTLDRYVHQLVMYAFRPIDEYPPISKEDWDSCPDSAKKWIQETYLINHIDHDPTNNVVTNLEYVTPRENSRSAVKFYDGNMANKSKITKHVIKKEPQITVLQFL